ncbi:hypothetical protein BBJ28_00014301 [Nothophytophthora sp. Chile5]|nr:hypothetical protein BBJ28_00014301 [Nothophytophthora sp. Chile5]
MLTGLRVRGNLMERQHLLRKVTAGSPEYQFLADLLASATLEGLLAHPYFQAGCPTGSVGFSSSSRALQEQRHIIGLLLKQELAKCHTMQRQYMQQIRVWHTHFEKQYQRKPKLVDRPAGIVRLQGRCQTLTDRVQQLGTRLASAHGTVYHMDAAAATQSDVISSLAIDVGDQLSSAFGQEQDDCIQRESSGGAAPRSPETRGSDPFEQTAAKRSPAQHAFLNRFAKGR